MYADRYGPKPLNPGSLTLSVGIVGGLVAAAMLSSTVIERVGHEHRLDTYAVPPPPAPPPPDPPKRQPEVQPQETHVNPPIQIVPVTPVQDTRVFDPGPAIDPPPVGAGTGTGTGTVPFVEPVRPPAPVLVGAEPDPRYLRDFQPSYPNEERRAGTEGVVTLRVLVGVDGRVRQVERVTSPSEAFWRVTQQQALSRWRFRPATRDGVAYEAWRRMTVRFRLETD